MTYKKDVLAKGTLQRGRALFKGPGVVFWDNEPGYREGVGECYVVGLRKQKHNLNPFDGAKSLNLPTNIDNIPVLYEWSSQPVSTWTRQNEFFTRPSSRDESVNEPYTTDSDVEQLRVYSNPMHAGLEIFAWSQHRRMMRGGTLGCVVWDTANSRPLLLGNAHVLANGAFNGNSLPVEQVGHPIYQPRYPDLAGYLLRWGTNNDPLDLNVDAAVATVAPGRSVNYKSFGPYGDFPRSAAIAPTIGDTVYIVGRSSGQQTGTVDSVSATTSVDGVDYADLVRLNSRISQSGDSGSLMFLTTGDNNPIGLFFAHSASYTWAIKSELVESDLGISFSHLPPAVSKRHKGLNLSLKLGLRS